MPSKKQYNLVQNDDYDTRIPLHPDEAFLHGITFHAKYIGTLEVPRPASRIEIVAAMRKIRYEFKAKGVKKKKVTIQVSLEGVTVSLRKKKKKEWLDGGPNPATLFSHPIYRIFYVSHDSQDLKIFSYIARDAATNLFRCNVFKSSKKNQAMRIVRTVGQAFEVCHKSTTGENTTSPEPPETTSLTNEPEVALSERESEKNINEHLKDCNSLDEHTNKEIPRLTQQDIVNTTTDSETIASNMISRDSSSSQTLEPPKLSSSSSPLMGRSLSTHHEVQLLKEQLEQQTQQTQAAIAQIQLLQDQLSAERAARLEAQTRTHQLLIHNRELLDHITALVSHLQDCERAQVPSQSKVSDVVPPHLTCVPQQICDPNSPYFGDYGYLSTSPDSPLRKSTPTGNIFAFNSITPEQNIQAQIMQQLANIGVYGSPQANNFGQFQYQPQIGQTYQNIYNQQLNNNNNVLQPPSKKKLPPSPLTLRQTFSNPYDPYSGISGNSDMFSNLSSREYSQLSKSLVSDIEKNQNLIKPLSQVGTLTTTDEEGRVRLIVPVPAGDNDKVVESLVTLKITDEEGNKRFVNGPPCITRSTSEKVPNKSELMSQVQRTTWARHTTK